MIGINSNNFSYSSKAVRGTRSTVPQYYSSKPAPAQTTQNTATLQTTSQTQNPQNNKYNAQVQADGSTKQLLPNGNVKITSADKSTVTIQTQDGIVISETKTIGNQTETRNYDNGELTSIVVGRNSGGHKIETTYSSEENIRNDWNG